MRKEEFFNIIGEVDEQKVAAAGMAMNTKKKSHPVWLKWGAMTACLCLVICAFALPRLFEKPNNSASGDLSPMVYVNDTLYRITSDQPDFTGKESQLVYLGTISSKVSSSQEPKENFQANDEIVGAKVYQYENDIVVQINGEYYLYKNRANVENEAVKFNGQLFNKSDLSEETLEWLERYNELSETEQLSISSIPSDLYELCGYGEGENTEVSGPTE